MQSVHARASVSPTGDVGPRAHGHGPCPRDTGMTPSSRSSLTLTEHPRKIPKGNLQPAILREPAPMNPILRNILAVIAGAVVCLFVNGLLISISASVIPPPAGVDPGDLASIKAHMDAFQPKHFVFPFLAHALGSLVGAWVAAMLATSHKLAIALTVGALHLVGGVAAAFMIPAPTWFIALDLGVAYLPMAWVGGKLGSPRAR